MYPWVVSFLMLLVIWTTLLHQPKRVSPVSLVATATTESSSLATATAAVTQCIPSATNTCSKTKNNNSIKKLYRTVQVQIVHRHGDRTPITPLRNEDIWYQELISSPSSSSSYLQRMSSLTNVLRDSSFTHKASGKGPFGRLTQTGFHQMIDLGKRLRQEFVKKEKRGSAHQEEEEEEEDKVDEHGHVWHRHVITDGDLHPHHVHIYSTDFERTLQSVQGVLAGLFPQHVIAPPSTDNENHYTTNNCTIFTIDARHTPWMIPDPQPRATQEQVELEQQLANRPDVIQQEEELRPLAIRATQALQDLLADGAMDVTFGVAEGSSSSNSKTDQHFKTLSWAQLAEITKCLRVRNMLPPSISEEDQEKISNHLAQKWFGLLRHARLSYLAMNRMTHMMLQRMKIQQHQQQQHQHQDHQQGLLPRIIIYSGHDSTLIGLMCAFRLEQPTQWPEYGSYLKVELIEEVTLQQHPPKEDTIQYWVRFSLNGQPLKSQWEHHDQGKTSASWLQHPSDEHLIPLSVLAHHIEQMGSVSPTITSSSSSSSDGP